MALGIVEQISLEEADVDLQTGDLLVLYTDGISDANSPAGEFFGVDRLREMVCAAGGLERPERIRHCLRAGGSVSGGGRAVR